MKPSDQQWPSGEPAPRPQPDRAGPPIAEVISIGRELLHGLYPDRNAREIAETLSLRGVRVRRLTVIDSNIEAIAGALREALDRNPHLLITSGGLGPARDDRTLAGLARVLGRPLGVNNLAREQVQEAYRRLAAAKVVPSAGITTWREKLFHLPVGSSPLANAEGPSPGVLSRMPGGTAVICLPGKPHELKPMLHEALGDVVDVAPPWGVARVEIESPTPDEASLRTLLDKLADEFPTMWVATHPSRSKKRGARIFVTLHAAAPKQEDAENAVEEARRRLLALSTGAY